MNSTHPLLRYRKAAGKSQERLAEEVGTSAATISRVERWAQEPSLSLIWRLKAVTGLAADDFIREAQ